MFGQGTADFSGRITGRARWSNFPRLRGGYAFPNCQGSIAVAEGAFVLFSMVGMSSLTDGEGVHVLMFRTEHEPHLWLNQVIAVGEGSIDPDAACWPCATTPATSTTCRLCRPPPTATPDWATGSR